MLIMIKEASKRSKVKGGDLGGEQVFPLSLLSVANFALFSAVSLQRGLKSEGDRGDFSPKRFVASGMKRGRRRLFLSFISFDNNKMAAKF